MNKIKKMIAPYTIEFLESMAIYNFKMNDKQVEELSSNLLKTIVDYVYDNGIEFYNTKEQLIKYGDFYSYMRKCKELQIINFID